MLTELESRNLIERAVDPGNKRRNIVTLTQAGVDQLRDLDVIVDAIQDELLAPLTATQRRQFTTLISLVADGSTSVR